MGLVEHGQPPFGLQNLLLTGGSAWSPVSKHALLQEIMHLLQTKKEFEELRGVEGMIRVPESVFPPNCT